MSFPQTHQTTLNKHQAGVKFGSGGTQPKKECRLKAERLARTVP